MKSILVMLSAVLLLSACSPKMYVDYSEEDKFHGFIGGSIVTLTETDALGVTFGSLREKKVDYVLIMPKPNFSGPEVVFRNPVISNTRFEITGVYGSNSAIFTNSYYFRVQNVNSDKYSEFILLIEFNIEELAHNGGLNKQNFSLLEIE